MYINLHTHFAVHKGVEILNIDIRQANIQLPLHYYSIGIHPWWIDAVNIEEKISFLEQNAADENFLAIGEIGLDRICGTDFHAQQEIFRRQVILAGKYSKPVIIHAVRAHDEILRMLREIHFMFPVVFHGFNRNVLMAEKIVKSGGYLSLGTDLLNEQSNAANVLRNTDISRIFFENDDRRVDIEEIYLAASKILCIKTDELCDLIEINFQKVFQQ